MKRFKLSLSLLASGLMAYSPVTMAAINTQQKTQMNSLIKEFSKSSFREIYNKYGLLIDAPSRGYFEKWLKNYGPEKIESIQIQPFKGAKNQEMYRVIMAFGGTSMIATIDPSNPNELEINGAKFNAWELQNAETLFKRLGAKDAKIAAIGKQLGATQAPAPQKMAVPKFPEFTKLTPDQKVQYFMMQKLIQESAEKVQNSMTTAQASNGGSEGYSKYSFHPLFLSILADAAELKGVKCGVAGYAHEYETGKYLKTTGTKVEEKNGPHCASFPKDSSKYKSVYEYSALCEHTGENAGGGNLIACNPLMFGAEIKQGRAVPYCQRLDRPNFTETATKKCNELAGIPDKMAPNSPDSIAKYRKILESLALLKGADFEVSKCFGKDDRIDASEKCRRIFEPIFAEHEAYFASVAKDCNPPELKQKTPDQKIFCEEFLKRSLAKNYFLQGTPVTTVDLIAEKEQKSCEEAGGDYSDKGIGHPSCNCPQGHTAEKDENNLYKKCLAPVVDVVGKPVPEKEDECKKDENKNSFSCNKVLWLGLGVIGVWLLTRRSTETTPTTPVNPPAPPCMGSALPCVYQWPSEGDNGKTAPPNAGGTRGAGQPAPKANKPPSGTDQTPRK